MPTHPQSDHRGYVLRSRLVVEAAIGKYLPSKAVVHHVDGVSANDSNTNLVACENDAYHQYIQKRTRAYKACGHANWLKCPYCKEYDNPNNLFTRINKGGATTSGFHKKCRADYEYNRRHGIDVFTA